MLLHAAHDLMGLCRMFLTTPWLSRKHRELYEVIIFSNISFQKLLCSNFSFIGESSRRPVQGVPRLRPKSAGIGSSPPATLQMMDGWMDGWVKEVAHIFRQKEGVFYCCQQVEPKSLHPFIYCCSHTHAHAHFSVSKIEIWPSYFALLKILLI